LGVRTFGSAEGVTLCIGLMGFCVASLVVGIVGMNRAMARAEQGNGVGTVV
jgi:hypothetical protein